MVPIVNPFDYELLQFVRSNPDKSAAAIAHHFDRNRKYVRTRLAWLVEAGYLRERRNPPETRWLEVTPDVANALEDG
ncbi:hypothetical protein BRD22_06280 [Halobacteriales archaeon SW_8_68_21]|nr:MAG: hypothetical protein BRD22_06280 [Halobacteriales archaeon SW_8_68_21]